MIATTTAFKTAIKASARRIKAKLILSDLTLEQVDKIELDSVMTDEDDFIIGTANMDSMKIEISDDPLAPLLYSFDGKEVEVQLGITLADLTIEYYAVGKYTVEKSDRKDSKIYLDLVDRMYKADKLYISDLTYPTTIGQILTSAAAQAGLSVVTGDYANKTYMVNIEPVYENITCRQIFGYIAELAGGYARINRSGSLAIMKLGSASVTSITGDHYIDYKKAESAPGVIDKLIVKNGTETASAGTGTNIYTIVDNLFVQNPADVVYNIYTVLATVNYKAGEMNWIGDFSAEMGDKVTIDGTSTYILNRKLKYSGGLRETLKMPGKSNIEKNSTGKPNTNLLINQIKTQIKIQNGLIDQVITEKADKTQLTNYSTISQTATAITNAVSSKADTSALADYSTKTQTATEISNAIVNKAEKSEVTQSATDLTTKFSSSGSKNLVANSGFQDGANGWALSGGAIAVGDTTSSPSGKRIRLTGSLGTTQLATQTVSKGFDPNNKKWALSALMMNTHTTKGTTNPFVDIQLTITYTDASKGYFQLTGNDLSIYDWVKKKTVITSNAAKTVASFTVGIYARDVTGNYLDVGYVRLEEGEVAHSWSNADNEAYETSFKLNALGFEMKDSNGGVLIEASKGIANEQNFGSTQNVESGYPLNMSFEIGDTTSIITSVKLKLKQYNFRTDSKGAASGGGSTSGPSSKSTSDEKWTGQGLSGVTVSQTNGAVGDTHNHAIGFNQFGHSHGMAHTHSTPAHSHSVDFGILETPNTNGTIDVYIDGVYRVSTTNTDTTLDITPWVTTNGVHTLELRSPTLKRIQADLFIKSYIRR